jgi:RNA polymerase sigma factor (sigma-70 family)
MEKLPVAPRAWSPDSGGPTTSDPHDRSVSARSFEAEFVAVFEANHPRVFRVLDRLSGDADVAADLVQEAFVRLYRRGSLPDSPGAWLVSVAMNLFRNMRTAKSRRLRLLTPSRAEGMHADAAPSPSDSAESHDAQHRVRRAMQRLDERNRRMLLLRAEGYRYREIAIALAINEASIGTLLARAQREFRLRYEEDA